jgi:hypothetical protein
MRLPQTLPYPWPYDGDVDPARVALLICGAHAPYWAPGDANDNIDRLITALATTDALTIATRHVPTSWPTRPSPAESGPPLRIADVNIDCHGYDAMFASSLESELRMRGRTHLLLCGYGGEVTVDSTIRTANDRGFECLLVADAVAWLDPITGAAAASSVTMSGGIFGAVGATDLILEALKEQP